MLLLFHEVQKIYKIEKLPHIVDIFSANIIGSISKFIQSKTIKNELVNKLSDIAKDGDLGKIIEFLQNSDLLQSDKETFKNSVIKTRDIYKKLNDIIMELESKEYMQQKSMNATLTISYLLFSYSLLLFYLFFLFFILIISLF
jgi:hypothetical protein